MWALPESSGVSRFGAGLRIILKNRLHQNLSTKPKMSYTRCGSDSTIRSLDCLCYYDINKWRFLRKCRLCFGL